MGLPEDGYADGGGPEEEHEDADGFVDGGDGTDESAEEPDAPRPHPDWMYADYTGEPRVGTLTDSETGETREARQETDPRTGKLRRDTFQRRDGSHGPGLGALLGKALPGPLGAAMLADVEGEDVLSSRVGSGAADPYSVQSGAARMLGGDESDAMLAELARRSSDPEYQAGKALSETAVGTATGSAVGPTAKAQIGLAGAEGLFEGASRTGELGGALREGAASAAMGTAGELLTKAPAVKDAIASRWTKHLPGDGMDAKQSIMGPDVDGVLRRLVGGGDDTVLGDAVEELLPESSVARSMFNPETGERFRTRAEFDRYMGLDAPESSASRAAVESSGIDPYASTQSAPPPADSGTVPGRRGARTDLERGLQEADTNVLPRDPATHMEIDTAAGGYADEMADPMLDEGFVDDLPEDLWSEDAFRLQRQEPTPPADPLVELGTPKPDPEVGIGTVSERNRMEAKHAGPWINPKLRLQMEMRARKRARQAARAGRDEVRAAGAAAEPPAPDYDVHPFELDTPPEPAVGGLEESLQASHLAGPVRPEPGPMPRRAPTRAAEEIPLEAPPADYSYPKQPRSDLDAAVKEIDVGTGDPLLELGLEPTRFQEPPPTQSRGDALYSSAPFQSARRTAGREDARTAGGEHLAIPAARAIGEAAFPKAMGQYDPPGDAFEIDMQSGGVEQVPWGDIDIPASTPSAARPDARSSSIAGAFGQVAGRVRELKPALYERVIAAASGDADSREIASISAQLNAVPGLNWSHYNPMRQEPEQ